MAKKEIALEIKIEAAQSAKTLGEMKKSLKELVAEQQNVARGSKDWDRLSKAINDAEGRIGDLQDSFSTLKGSGIERATSSLSLLREGITNLDFEKVKIGLGGVKAALAATGIMLFVQGVMALIENFDKLKNSGGLLGTVFTKIGEGIDWIVEKLEVFGDMIGLIDKDLNDMSEAIDKNAEKNKEALDSTTAAYDRQIKVAQAAGKSTVEIEKAKQKAFIETNLVFVKQIEAFVRAGGELDDQKKKLLTASLEAIKNAKTEEKVIELKAETDKQKAGEEALKKLQERHERERQELQKQNEAKLKAAKDEEAWQEASMQYLTDKEALAAKQKLEYEEGLANAKASIFNDTVAAGAKSYDEDVENFKKAQELKNQVNKTSLDAAQAMSQAFFMFQSRAAEGNEAKLKQIRKRAFQVEKAFNAARAIQDGIAATQKALLAGGGVPTGIPFAVATGALAAANVAKILAAKFDEGGARGGDLSTPNISAGNTSVPTINNAANAAPIQPTTTFNEQGQNTSMMVKAYVVESEVSDAQEKADKRDRLREY